MLIFKFKIFEELKIVLYLSSSRIPDGVFVLSSSRNRNTEKEQSSLPIEKVLMEEQIFEKALQQGSNTDTEIGFYMIGLVRNRNAFVYDILEFPYMEQSCVSVISEPEKLGNLFNAVPAGLSVLGLFHKHPKETGTSYSSRDKQTFLKWSNHDHNVHIIFSNRKVQAYTVRKNKVYEITFKATSLPPLTATPLNISLQTNFYFPERSSVLDLLQQLEKELTSEIVKRYSPIRLKGKTLTDKVKKEEQLTLQRKNVVYVASPTQKSIAYQFFGGQHEQFRDIKGKIISTLSLEEDTQFLVENQEVSNDTSLSQLFGKILYPKKREA